ncbi:Retrovirus-related Pol polyprotein from type-1 retrotransposable element R2 (Fragment) [Anthophora plagiata]
MDAVLAEFDRDGTQSVREVSRRVGVSRSTVHQLLQDEDFFFWGYLKTAVYERPVQTREEANITTVLECHGKRSEPLQIKRGVKQGDPMSGFLFNLTIDNLLRKLNQRNGLKIGESNVVALAFADDIVIAAPTPTEMQAHINIIEKFFEHHGLEANVEKCTALQTLSVPGTKRLVVQTKPLLKISNRPVPVLCTANQLKYLGHKYTYSGVKAPSPSNMEEMIARLAKSPLKPWQKLNVLQRYLIPKLHHGMQTIDVTKKKLQHIDRTIIKFVKATLHLPKTTPTAFIHAPLRGGGLGIPALSLHIPAVYLRRLERLSIRGDSETKSALQTPVIQTTLTKLRRMLRDVNLAKKSAVQTFWTEQLHSSGLGAGLRATTPGVSSWIYDPPPVWKGRDYIGAINLRIGLLPTRGAPYMKHTDCRNASCAGTRETLYHILQRCPVTHYNRINRHDNINKTLKESIQKKGHKCEEAPRINTQSDRYIPDLIAIHEDTAYIIETTVSYESKSNSISNAYAIKKEKYSKPEIAQKVKNMYNTSEVVVMPFVVGARGSWVASNDAITQTFNLPRGLRETICRAALQ